VATVNRPAFRARRARHRDGSVLSRPGRLIAITTPIRSPLDRDRPGRRSVPMQVQSRASLCESRQDPAHDCLKALKATTGSDTLRLRYARCVALSRRNRRRVANPEKGRSFPGSIQRISMLEALAWKNKKLTSLRSVCVASWPDWCIICGCCFETLASFWKVNATATMPNSYCNARSWNCAMWTISRTGCANFTIN
jgi:hypothetical protein